MSKTPVKSVRLTSIALAQDDAAIEFDVPVSISRKDGSVFELTVRAQALRRSDWTKQRDTPLPSDETGDDAANVLGLGLGLGVVMDRASDKALSDILFAARSWDLQEPLNAASLCQLEDVLQGSLNAILTALDRALLHGRVGN